MLTGTNGCFGNGKSWTKKNKLKILTRCDKLLSNNSAGTSHFLNIHFWTQSKGVSSQRTWHIRPFQDNLHLHKGQRVYFGQACHFWFPCDSNKQGSYVSEGGRRSLIHGLRSEIKHKWKERTALSWDWYFLLVQGHWTRTTEIYTVIVKLFQFAEGAGNFFF